MRILNPFNVIDHFKNETRPVEPVQKISKKKQMKYFKSYDYNGHIKDHVLGQNIDVRA